MPFDQSSPDLVWLADIRAVAADLATIHAPIEDAFLVVGDGLTKAHGTARTLVAMAAGLASRLSEPEFRHTLDGLSDAQAIVQALSAGAAGRDADLAGVSSAAKGISGLLDRLANAMSGINALGISARIEAARMVHHGIDFTVFTHGIAHLAARGQASIGEARAALGRLQTAIAGAAQRRDEFRRLHLVELRAVGDRLGQSVGALRTRERDAGATLQKLPERIGAVHHRIGQLVTDLQIGDMTRQRLEHVQEALSSLEAAADAVTLDPQRLSVLVNAVADLQRRQLDGIEKEFSVKTAAVVDNLDRLACDLTAIRGDILTVHAGDEQGGSSFLLEVDADIERILKVVDAHAAAAADVEASILQATEAAAAMGGSMRAIAEVDADLNVVGLNASIKCGNLRGNGRSLNVIAQELRAFARETRSLSEGVGGCLSRVTAAAAALGDDEGRGEDVARLKEALLLAVDRLRQAGGETSWVLADIRRRSEEMADTLQSARGRLAVRDSHIAKTRQAGQRLGALADASNPQLSPQDLEAARRDVLAFMEGRYTMETERDIHNGAAGSAIVTGATAAGEHFDAADFLF